MPVLDVSDISDYRILISHSERRPLADWYTIDLQDSLPTLAIPLLSKSESATLNLQTLLNAVYDRGGFDYVLDYNLDLSPPIKGEKQEWAMELLVDKGLRSLQPIPCTLTPTPFMR